MRRFVLDITGLDLLLGALADAGYRTIGPTAAGGMIQYGPVADSSDFPVGVTDRQSPGAYRLDDRGDELRFGYAVGAGGLKPLVFPPHRELWTATVANDRIRFEPADADPPYIAVVGARACDIAALRTQERVFEHGPYPDLDFSRRRRHLFLVAVDCAHPAETCFCSSLGTGPAADTGFDIGLTEVVDQQGHRFLGRIGSEAGATVLASVPTREATEADLAAAEAELMRSAAAMTRGIDPRSVPEGLRRNPEHDHWEDVARRCLACANCTMVCPTCFCSTTEDGADLEGTSATRSRRWDTCFSLDFSFMGGRPERASVRSRYRQWLTHKLSTWTEQFGTLGCVGCGRCITWCPVGIDLTREVAALVSPEAADA